MKLHIHGRWLSFELMQNGVQVMRKMTGDIYALASLLPPPPPNYQALMDLKIYQPRMPTD
jgi:hypothetical protein